MSIIGELKFADDAFKPTAETLKLLYGETWGMGYDMGFDAGYASADAWFVDHADELAEHGWVKLPVDADGVPIHIGDEVEEFDTRTVGKARGEVIRIVFGKYGTDVRIDTGLSYADRNPENVRHGHRAPTVEDVLREFGKCWDDPAHYAKGELVEAYADRIREAGEHE